jgi:hypothetical protein
VLPIALYLSVGLDGLGVDVYEEHVWEFRPLHFAYLYVGLPALDAWTYVRQDNWLGVALAALMKVPREQRVELGLEALTRLAACPENDYRKHLLGACVQEYLPLSAAEWDEYNRRIVSEPRYQGALAMQNPRDEQVRAEGERRLLQEQLEERFGPITGKVRDRLAAWPSEQLRTLGRALLKAQSLKELGLDE